MSNQEEEYYTNFSKEIYDTIESKQIELYDNKSKDYLFKDDTSNKEWFINKDYTMGIMEMRVICKITKNDNTFYKMAQVYNSCSDNMNNAIKYKNLCFHIEKLLDGSQK